MYHSGGKNVVKNYVMTNIADVVMKPVTIPDSDAVVELHMYDTAGADIYAETRNIVYQNPSLVAIVYDATNQRSFTNSSKWCTIVAEHFHNRKMKGVLIANKVDVDSVVTTAQGKSLAVEFGLEYFETAATEGKDVDIPFNFLADSFYKLYQTKISQFQP